LCPWLDPSRRAVLKTKHRSLRGPALPGARAASPAARTASYPLTGRGAWAACPSGPVGKTAETHWQSPRLTCRHPVRCLSPSTCACVLAFPPFCHWCISLKTHTASLSARMHACPCDAHPPSPFLFLIYWCHLAPTPDIAKRTASAPNSARVNSGGLQQRRTSITSATEGANITPRKIGLFGGSNKSLVAQKPPRPVPAAIPT